MRTAEQDDADVQQVARIQAWLFVIGFFLLAGAAEGVYASQGVDPSPRFEWLLRLGGMIFAWYWVRQECRRYRPAYPMDFGLFVSLVGAIIVPYYLWRYERWRGLGKAGIVGLAMVGSSVVSVVVEFLLTK